MIRKPPTFGPDTKLRDVDLDKEDVRLPDGTRLTEARAEQITAEVTKGQGRPSLTGQAARSPQIGVRVTPELRTRLEKRAKREKKTVSEIARDAIEHYV